MNVADGFTWDADTGTLHHDCGRFVHINGTQSAVDLHVKVHRCDGREHEWAGGPGKLDYSYLSGRKASEYRR